MYQRFGLSTTTLFPKKTPLPELDLLLEFTHWPAFFPWGNSNEDSKEESGPSFTSSRSLGLPNRYCHSLLLPCYSWNFIYTCTLHSCPPTCIYCVSKIPLPHAFSNSVLDALFDHAGGPLGWRPFYTYHLALSTSDEPLFNAPAAFSIVNLFSLA